MNRHALLIGTSALFLVSTLALAQAQPQFLQAPKGFDAKRKDAAKGNIETLEYMSKTVGAKRKIVVYTPPGFNKDTKYPIFYLLHGKGGNETSWTKGGSAATILDNLYADKKAVPMIVVMPNGTVEAKGAKGGKGASGFESELINDVMPFAESKYQVKAGPENHAVAGLSMGGGQALTVGLKHLDKFAWIGGFSSAIFGANNIVSNGADANKKIKLLYVACGDSPEETLFNSNKNFHTSLEKLKVDHLWNVFPAGKHNYQVWKNDLHIFGQMVFQEKKAEKKVDKK